GPPRSPGQRPRTLHEPVELLEHSARVAHEIPSERAEQRAAAAALEQSRADRPLEARDLRRQRRLADAEPLGGPPKALRLRDRDEVLELAERDARLVARDRHDRYQRSPILNRLSSVISGPAFTLQLRNRHSQRRYAWSKSSQVSSASGRKSSRSTASSSRSSRTASARKRCSSRAPIPGSTRTWSRRPVPAISSSSA